VNDGWHFVSACEEQQEHFAWAESDGLDWKVAPFQVDQRSDVPSEPVK
jgi:hypothetical protein